ncbi:unnamed protein product [Lota lota]
MFIEDNEWNDDQASETTSKPILTKTVEKSNGIITFKPKGVGKKSLLRTLQRLGPALDQKSDHVQKDSDSEPEPESAPARPKRKKKRNRGRKKTDEAGTDTAGLGDDKKADNVPKETKGKDSKTVNGKSKVTPEIMEENELNRKQWKNKMKNRRKCKNKYREKELEPDEPESPTENQDAEEEEEEEEGAASTPVDRSASLRSRMEQRLEAARFRYINEVLYTSSSGEAKRMFSQDPQAFGIYHKGFTAQVRRWPANPVDAIIAYIHKKPASHVVADFGCGDCKIALSVKNKVHSFDLAPICNLVTVCDMANVPLKDGSVHIAVFCLSLMGTNLIDFLVEANRVLVVGGVLKIAEVASRFDDVRGFLTTLSNLGFKMTLKDTENSHFYSFDFLKIKEVSENMKSSSLELRPCVYKKR